MEEQAGALDALACSSWKKIGDTGQPQFRGQSDCKNRIPPFRANRH